ncbi:unnamed protein product [Penicillium discolor]
MTGGVANAIEWRFKKAKEKNFSLLSNSRSIQERQSVLLACRNCSTSSSRDSLMHLAKELWRLKASRAMLSSFCQVAKAMRKKVQRASRITALCCRTSKSESSKEQHCFSILMSKLGPKCTHGQEDLWLALVNLERWNVNYR